MEDLTIKEVKKLKTELDGDIQGLINKFEDDTKMRVSYISLTRTGDKNCIPEDIISNDRGDVSEVNSDLNLDLNL